jgi:hypothetical protein
VKVLAKLDVGEGREAAILERDDGTTCWSTDLGSGETSDESAMMHVPAGTLVAGEAPVGRGTVRVSDATQTIVAGGKFLALIAGQEREEAFVVVMGEDNAPVPPEDELKRTPVDVEVRCPDCGGLSWDRVEWRAAPDAPTARKRALVCRTCGFYEDAEQIGRRRRPEPDLEFDPGPLPEDPSAAQLIEAAPFPVYVPSKPSRGHVRLRQHGWRPGSLTSVELAVGRVSVRVDPASEEPSSTPLERARRRLASALDSDLIDAMSKEERGLDDDVFWLKHRDGKRALDLAVQAASSRSLSLPVEREPVEFALVEHGGVWAASTQIENHHVAVVGRRVAPEKVALRRLEPGDELA